MKNQRGWADTAKLVVILIIAALLVLFISYVGRKEEQAAQGQQRGEVIKTTAGVAQDGAKADTVRVEIDTSDMEPRTVFIQTKEEAKRNEPTTRDRADRPVPDSVRRAYRERRLARERLDRRAAEHAPDAGAEGARER